MKAIDARFGTWRGAVRLLLSHGERLLGVTAARLPARGEVQRLVFVCQGNICRSAFAEAIAHKLGVPAASFGLATTTGLPADPAAQRAAQTLGVAIPNHRTTARADFAVRPGDLLLAMETRQLRRLAADPELSRYPRALLGAWAMPPAPHLHDPFELSDAYFRTCFRRIAGAVRRVAREVSAPAP